MGHLHVTVSRRDLCFLNVVHIRTLCSEPCTLAKYDLSYIINHPPVSVAFATIIMVPEKNTDKI
jgi:hypothetical protein